MEKWPVGAMVICFCQNRPPMGHFSDYWDVGLMGRQKNGQSPVRACNQPLIVSQSLRWKSMETSRTFTAGEGHIEKDTMKGTDTGGAAVRVLVL